MTSRFEEKVMDGCHMGVGGWADYFFMMVFSLEMDGEEMHSCQVYACIHHSKNSHLTLLRGTILTLLGPQSRFGDILLIIRVLCAHIWECGAKGPAIYTINIPVYISLFLLILRGTIVNRTYDIHKNLYIGTFLITIFGPINYGPP